ncbi:DUF975 family protein [Paenisporosarcina quisquiliarum]|uniref:DUF975 family protein n=1 Tax=Paenisporosarcina quisquiliarum TaxID=365346 RepID=UPI0037370EEE
MKISELKRQARLSLRGKWGLAIILTLIVFLINIILPLIVEIIISGGFTQWLFQDKTPLGASIFNTLLYIVLLPLTIAVYWFYLTLVRKENPALYKVFSIYKDGKNTLKLIYASILQGVLLLLWTLLLIIPGLIKSMSYSQMFFLLRDFPELTVLEAISESKKRMRGLKWKYFLMNLSFIGWGILCLFSLGIGFLWLVPYIGTTMAIFYNELIASQENSSK